MADNISTVRKRRYKYGINPTNLCFDSPEIIEMCLNCEKNNCLGVCDDVVEKYMDKKECIKRGRKQKPKKVRINQKIKKMCDRCKKCEYSDRIGDGTTHFICGYLLKTGKMRPCPAGPECTVYKTKTREKRGSHYHEDEYIKIIEEIEVDEF